MGRVLIRAGILAALVGCVLAARPPLVPAGTVVDADGDGVDDLVDTCTASVFAPQTDTDADGFGDWCDPDYDNTGIVTMTDWNLFHSCYRQQQPGGTADMYSVNGISCAAMDGSGDGVVSLIDYQLHFPGFFGLPPGPSGLPCASTDPTAPNMTGETPCLPGP